MRRPALIRQRDSGAALFVLVSLVIALATSACAPHPLNTVREKPAIRSFSVSAAALLAIATASASPSPTALPATPSSAPVPTASPLSATPEPAPQESEAEPTPEPAPSHAEPVRLSIPKIGVNSSVIPVGEDSTGAMASPDNPVDVAWWNLGARPGDYGSAVIGGHVDFAGYGAAVFWNLKLMRPGDPVFVQEADGTALKFTVTEVDSYVFNDPTALDIIFRTTDHQGLNLITCTGTFNPLTHNYDQRVVVYTTLAGQ
jgi:sortase (surface protein transpeptidase)